MKKLSELGISPAPWREWDDDVVAADDSSVVLSYDESYLSGPDAMLIAAAPELYEALCDLVEIVENVFEYVAVDGGTLGKISKAKAALAKAGGEEVK